MDFLDILPASFLHHDIVDVDETINLYENLGYKRTRQLWVMGCISRRTKEIYRECFQKDQDTLFEILGDYWKGYSKCTRVFSGHKRMNYSKKILNSSKDEPFYVASHGRFNDGESGIEFCIPSEPDIQPYRSHTETIGIEREEGLYIYIFGVVLCFVIVFIKHILFVR